MSEPGDAKTFENTPAGRAGAAEKPRASAKTKTAREDRLAKALRENLRRRKAGDKKD